MTLTINSSFTYMHYIKCDQILLALPSSIFIIKPLLTILTTINSPTITSPRILIVISHIAPYHLVNTVAKVTHIKFKSHCAILLLETLSKSQHLSHKQNGSTWSGPSSSLDLNFHYFPSSTPVKQASSLDSLSGIFLPRGFVLAVPSTWNKISPSYLYGTFTSSNFWLKYHLFDEIYLGCLTKITLPHPISIPWIFSP